MDSLSGDATRLIGGRYRLQAKLGQGGMGTVWRAHDELLHRTIAIKEVDLSVVAALDRALMRERTLREARTAARLSHPNAVTVYDVVEDQGQPWIVMSLVVADSLDQVIREQGTLAPRRAAEVGLALLSALDAAHKAGILHRDVKPSNVLVGHDGSVVLTDFGIATLEGDASLTSTGMLFGAPAYIAPERARGERPGPASDLWSLGATLYTAVDGSPPFERDTPMATLTALVTEDLVPPRSAGPLRPALMALLERDPRRRIDAAGARQLLQQAAGHPGDATRPMQDRTPTRALPPVGAPAGTGPPPAVWAPEPAWAGGPPPQVPAPDYQQPRRSRALVLLLVLALVAAGVAAVVYLGNDDGSGVRAQPNASGRPSPTPSATPSPTPAPAAKNWPTVSIGDSGVVVRAAQHLLRFAGASGLEVNGDYDEPTLEAVFGFQEGRGLPVTGDIDAATWSALAVSLKRGSINEAVRALQILLNDQGEELKVDGRLGEATEGAVKAFQEANGLPAAGVVGTQTWKQLLVSSG